MLMVLNRLIRLMVVANLLAGASNYSPEIAREEELICMLQLVRKFIILNRSGRLRLEITNKPMQLSVQNNQVHFVA